MSALSPILNQATPVVVDHAQGCRIHGADGRDYLDFTAGIGVTSTGHCHPRVVEAAQKQVGTVIHAQYTTVMHRPLLQLTDKLGEVLPAGLDSLFYANSGSEAVEAALRLARMATGRPNIIAFHGGFHGRTVATASLTSSGTKFRTGFSPLMAGVHFAPFPYAYRLGWDEDTAVDFCLRELDYLFQTISAPSDSAAFILEPVIGEGGYIPVPQRFLEGIRERADKYGMLLIGDEIQAGVGRTGKFWGHQHTGVAPDVMTIAKGFASGFPISAIAASEPLMAKALPGSQGGTYGGNAVAAAAACATLDVIRDENLVDNARDRGAELNAALHRLAEAHPVGGGKTGIGDVRGLGLMQAIEFTGPGGEPDAETALKVREAAVGQGLLLLGCGVGNVVRVIPPLIATTDDIAEGERKLGAAVGEVLGGGR